MSDKNLVPQNRKDLPQSGKSLKTTLKEFMLPWAKLCAAYPRHDLSAATLTVYYERLARYDINRLVVAVNLAIDRCKFFPTVAELIESVASLAPAHNSFISEDRPSREEAKAVLESLHAAVREFESKDLAAREKKLAERKLELKNQARRLGVKSI